MLISLTLCRSTSFLLRRMQLTTLAGQIAGCRALARKNGYELQYNQEIVSLGLANFVGAFFSSYTTTGSFSRSAISNSCGET